MSEEQARTRLGGTTNSALFLLAHLIDVRHFLVKARGGRAHNPLAGALADASKIDEVRELPPVRELLPAWDAACEALEMQLARTDPAQLDGDAPQRFPVEDPSLLGEIAFLVQHESYHHGADRAAASRAGASGDALRRTPRAVRMSVALVRRRRGACSPEWARRRRDRGRRSRCRH